MSEQFSLNINYNNQELELESEFQPWGYTYRINIRVNDMIVVFEPDEERNYRAIIPLGETLKKQPDPLLLQAIVNKLEEVFK